MLVTESYSVAGHLAFKEQQNVACRMLRTAQVNNMQPIQTEDFKVEVGKLPDGAYVSLLFPTPYENIPLIEIILFLRGMEIKLLDSLSGAQLQSQQHLLVLLWNGMPRVFLNKFQFSLNCTKSSNGTGCSDKLMQNFFLAA